MADEYIFGPFDTDYSSYTAALNYANKYRADSSVPRFSVGDTITITKGELHPLIEQTMLDDLAARREAKQAQAEPKQEKPKKGRKAAGRFGMLNNWVDYGQHYFSMSAGRVWLTIFRLADGKNNTVKFGYRSLAEKAGVGRNTAQRAISAFEKAGILVCIFKSPKQGIPSQYKLVDATNELTKQPPKPKRSRPQR